MRQLTTGLVIGFLFGAALAASAGYYDHQAWTQMLPTEQLDYVAGVTDAIQAVNGAIQVLGAEHAAELINTADRCTDPLKLGEVRDIARGAVAKHPDMSPAEALFLELWNCSPQTPQPQPEPQPQPQPQPQLQPSTPAPAPNPTSGYVTSARP
jgi:hypothetical protein